MTSEEKEVRAALEAVVAEYPAPPDKLPSSLLHAINSSGQPLSLSSTLTLLRAQWPLIGRGTLFPSLAAFVMLVFTAAAGAASEFDLLTLTAALPVAAALFVVLLSGPKVDPAHPIVMASRTPFGAVVFARTTVALALLVALSLPASALVSLVTGKTLTPLVTAWLGPTVLIGAVATLLAQVTPRAVAVSIAVSAWGSVVAAIYLELTARWAPSLSLAALLDAGWAGALAQMATGAALLAAGWFLAVRHDGMRAEA